MSNFVRLVSLFGKLLLLVVNYLYIETNLPGISH